MTPQPRLLSQPAWDALLARLGPDLEAAGVQYEQLRRRLIRFFEWKGCAACEDHADDVLTRMARKIAAGESIANVQAYALGVARFVLKEAGAVPVHVLIDDDAMANAALAVPPVAEADARAACLDKCLDRMPRATRSLTLRYYEGTGGTKVSNRHTLARELGITERALRLRVFRARESLELCVNDCLSVRGRTKPFGVRDADVTTF